MGQFLREFLDRAVQDRRSLGVIADQDLIERLLVDLVRRLLAERIFARLAEGFSPAVEYLAECALRGPVAQIMVVFLQLDVEAIHVYRRQAGGTVAPNGRCSYDVFSHAGLALPAFEVQKGQRRGNPLVSLEAVEGLENVPNPCISAGFRPTLP